MEKKVPAMKQKWWEPEIIIILLWLLLKCELLSRKDMGQNSSRHLASGETKHNSNCSCYANLRLVCIETGSCYVNIQLCMKCRYHPKHSH